MIDKLIKKFIGGDASAFEEIYAKTRKAVYYAALAILRERESAEDIMQTTYLKVLKNIGQYKPGTNAEGWIIRIARNEAINLKKQRSREESVDSTENPVVFGGYESDGYSTLIGLAESVLTEDEFTVLMLVTACGYKRREIAAMLNQPVSTVSWIYGNALKKMRSALEEENG